ncbi:MAG TPA: hypothetical protein DEP53_12550 [Bacteroidetes bacterium]|nr:hypothetical protein [Bacteroidota bacterium]
MSIRSTNGTLRNYTVGTGQPRLTDSLYGEKSLPATRRNFSTDTCPLNWSGSDQFCSPDSERKSRCTRTSDYLPEWIRWISKGE